VDIIQRIEVLAFLTHGRSHSKDDFQLINEAFNVEESRVPQLIFVDNPYKLFDEGKRFNEIIEQHETFSKGVQETIELCIEGAQNNFQRLAFRRMLKRFCTHLFISHKHKGGNSHPYLELQPVLTSCLDGVVKQRLKPAVDMVVASLFELKTVLSSKKLKSSLPEWQPSFGEMVEFELNVNLVDEDNLRERAQDLAQQHERFRQVKETKDFLFSQCSSEGILQELVDCIIDFHVSEVAHRIFTICKLSVEGGGEHKSFDDEKNQCFDEFSNAFDHVEALAGLNFETEVESQSSSKPKTGRPSYLQQKEKRAEVRDRKFGLYFNSHLKVTIQPSFIIDLVCLKEEEEEETILGLENQAETILY